VPERLGVSRWHDPEQRQGGRGLIYQGELDSEIERSDYFDHWVPFKDLLGA
jgi:hypothetical protein